MLHELFGPDSRANQQRWVRSDSNPVIRPEGTGWADDFIAACAVVEVDGELRLFAEGSVGGHEQIGLFTAPAEDEPEGASWKEHATNPVLRVGTGFDQGGVFDPAVVKFQDRWLMYYSATEGDAHAFAEQLEHGVATGEPADETIGLAISDDGIGFSKHPGSPVLKARCPFALVHEQTVYLFYVKITDGGYRVHLATSEDGVSFVEHDAGPVLDVGPAGSWDAYTVTTPKVFRDGDRWCMTFAGDTARLDDPTGIGLAVSADLRTWEKIPGNPIFTVGSPDEFDSVSVASPIIRRHGRRYYMWYAGSDRSIRDGLHSQVGLAWISEAR
jgi:predicted GH43/DUF377 family glycosyl hydrolase